MKDANINGFQENKQNPEYAPSAITRIGIVLRGGDEMRFSVVDLFGAPGGMAAGLKMTSKFAIKACVDSDKKAAQTYRQNFPEAEVIDEPIENVTGHSILHRSDLSKGDIDLVVGGPPCQAFSIVGRVKLFSLKGGPRTVNGFPATRFINDQKNVLYKHFVRIVSELSPKYFIMENVRGLLSYRNGETVEMIKQDFREIGYECKPLILDASKFGVPQKRMRVVFIGNKLKEENPSHEDIPEKSEVTVWEAISDLPFLEAGKGIDPTKYSRKSKSSYQRWARQNSRLLRNHVARPHRPLDIRAFRKLRPGEKWSDLPVSIRRLYGYRDDVFQDKMKRLCKNRPSWTVVAHLAKDGYMFIHPTQERTITVREAARLQSFPDSFVFSGSRSDQFRQVGNAVPPRLAEAVGLCIADRLKSA